MNAFVLAVMINVIVFSQVKQFHPDVRKSDDDDMIRRVIQAYEVVFFFQNLVTNCYLVSLNAYSDHIHL